MQYEYAITHVEYKLRLIAIVYPWDMSERHRSLIKRKPAHNSVIFTSMVTVELLRRPHQNPFPPLNMS